jgi:hypothetical protein
MQSEHTNIYVGVKTFNECVLTQSLHISCLQSEIERLFSAGLYNNRMCRYQESAVFWIFKVRFLSSSSFFILHFSATQYLLVIKSSSFYVPFISLIIKPS